MNTNRVAGSILLVLFALPMARAGQPTLEQIHRAEKFREMRDRLVGIRAQMMDGGVGAFVSIEKVEVPTDGPDVRVAGVVDRQIDCYAQGGRGCHTVVAEAGVTLEKVDGKDFIFQDPKTGRFCRVRGSDKPVCFGPDLRLAAADSGVER